MSNYDFIPIRRRKRTLLVVEGKHEKETLFKQLLQCFPEINIALEDIIVFETNIYILY